MEQKTTIINKKKQFIEIFPKNNFNISKTCRDLSIGRKQYYKWMEKESFKEKLKESVERKKDLIEDKLFDEAMNGNITALIFLAKTQMKERGYVEKQELEIGGDLTLLSKEERVAEIERLLKK